MPSNLNKNLDENEWLQIKQKCNERDDFKEPCVICKEPLGKNQQVLNIFFQQFHRH